MAKKVGFEVVSTRPVCVDFRDGRTVSYRPGQRFEAARTNSSVQRLLRVRELRELGPFEAVPPMPVKLGATRRVQNILKRRSEVDQARRAALAKMAASKKAPPKSEPVVDLATPLKKKKKTSKKSKPTPNAPERSSEGK
jgi:sulfite reductase alpha subunit-like flavoprotein